jgi:hypothetical protein
MSTARGAREILLSVEQRRNLNLQICSFGQSLLVGRIYPSFGDSLLLMSPGTLSLCETIDPLHLSFLSSSAWSEQFSAKGFISAGAWLPSLVR